MLIIKILWGISKFLLWIKIDLKNNTFEKRFCDFLIFLGPVFIKFGQSLATRVDFVGSKLAQNLLQLQDNLQPFNFKTVKKIIEKEFDQALDEVFAQFEENPLSAASVAQVHKAILIKNKKVVAVKVLRPKIEKKIANNLKSLRNLLKVAEFFYAKKLQKYRFQETFILLEKNFQKELDLRFEAANFSQIRENGLKDGCAKIPRIFWEHTKKEVLTMEWIEGKSILNFKNHPEIKNINQSLIFTFFNQAYRDGLFHGDLHSGNILIDENLQICLIDFGSVGILDQETRLYLAEILRGFLHKDYQKVADIQFAANFVPKTQNKTHFMLACRTIGETCIHNNQNVSIAQVLQQFLAVLQIFSMEIQPQLLLFQKNLIMLEGICQQLDPDTSIWDLARPWVAQWSKENFALQKILWRRTSKFYKNAENFCELSKKIGINLENLTKNKQIKKTFGILEFLLSVIVIILLIIIFFILRYKILFLT